jgi:putative colanic acid biosynthesis UDP-glucose lipid carrier transferase
LAKDASSHNELLGYFDSAKPEDKYFDTKYLGSLEEVKAYALNHHVQEIYYTLPNDAEYLGDLSAFADKNFIFLGIVPDIKVKEKKKIHTKYLEDVDLPVMSYEYSPLQQQINSTIKRSFDIAFSSVVILLLGPIAFIIIGLSIKLSSPGPIFFVQQRPGKRNKLFNCYKFRTMRVNNAGHIQATKNDSRITKVGAFLRRTSLDELPQFFNVLKGDMSIVGPRPNLVHHLTTYSNIIPDYPLRHIVYTCKTGVLRWTSG